MLKKFLFLTFNHVMLNLFQHLFRPRNKFGVTLFVSVFIFNCLYATPSTVYWTPCTPYIQPYGVGHITYDIYARNANAMPITMGFTTGVLPYEKVGMEIGYDGYIPTIPTSAAHQLNAKIGLYEDKVLPVGINIGLFGIGFEKDVSDLNAVHIDAGKTTKLGAFSAGYYSGNKKILGDSNSGLMTGYLSPDISSPIKGIKKIIFAADYMGGDNSYSAWGFGLYAYFSDAVDLLAGPVFPLSEKFFGGKDMLWTLQLDIDFAIFSK